MPRLNTSNTVKERIEHLLAMLLAYANDELPEDYDRLRSKLTVRWLEEEREHPRLIVKTELRFLAELVFKRQSNKLKETLKQDLQVLSKFLDILEDNRTKTQGSAIWHFTLTLWHKSAERNLQEFQRQWAQRKSNAKPPEGQSPDRQQDIRAAQDFTIPKKRSSLFSRAGFMLDAGAVPPGSLPNAVPAQLDLNQTPSQVRPYSNLPARDYATFIGRQQQLAQVLELLSFNSSVARISIEGIGGVGKTSLVLEAAHRCWQSSRNSGDAVAVSDAAAPSFDAIIFTSAKLQHFTPRGVLPRFKRERTLGQIFRAIARTLDFPGILAGNLDDQVDAVRTCLGRQRTLLIVDNLETIEEQEPILSFLYDLPATVKAIVTSRDRTLLDVSIHLSPLDKAESLRFIEHQSQLKTVQLSNDNVQTLYQGTGGMPAAMVYAIGQLANGYPLPTVLPRLTKTNSDFCYFHFESALQALRGQSAHQLLMALALFPQSALKAAISQVALPDANSINTTDDFARLHQLSLIVVQGERCDMLPLTREYMLAELAAYPEFEQEARERWLQWSLQFAAQYGSQDWRTWQDYNNLDREWGNLQTVIEWCLTQKRYEAFGQLWSFVRGYTYLYGYWNERLVWMEEWLQAARQQSKPEIIVQALRDKAWMLAMMSKSDQLAEADRLFEQAWSMRDDIDRSSQLELAIERGLLCSHQSQLEAAHIWLDRAKALLPQAQLDEVQHLRQSIRIDYYEAGVWFRQGDCDRAKTLYQQALTNARIAQWPQLEVYTLNWLADIALEQADLDTAERLLNQSQQIAPSNPDKRSVAFHHRSWAHLAKLRGNPIHLQRSATAAKTTFEQLNMHSEAQEMQSWLDDESDWPIAITSTVPKDPAT